MNFIFGIEITKSQLIRKVTWPYREIIRFYYILKSYNKTKVFCIGLNKTGTTSLEKAMRDFGFIIGDQREAEYLFKDWVIRDFKKLVRYCKSAVFFQDSPFSHSHTFIALDQAFPRSKFILTIRDSSDQWYNSLVKFHGKLWGNGNVPPTAEDLKNSSYVYKGMPYYVIKHLYNTPDNELYKKDVLVDYYETHIKNVKDYFSFRQNDLLILNVADDGAYEKLTTFLNIKTNKTEFPWENKTDEK
jgi:hypothetical protein